MIFDGKNKVKKRWAIGIAAIAGIVQTLDHLPEWVRSLTLVLAGAF